MGGHWRSGLYRRESLKGDLMSLFETLIVAGFSSAGAAIGAIATIKTEISWIKEQIKDLNKRILHLERR